MAFRDLPLMRVFRNAETTSRFGNGTEAVPYSLAYSAKTLTVPSVETGWSVDWLVASA